MPQGEHVSERPAAAGTLLSSIRCALEPAAFDMSRFRPAALHAPQGRSAAETSCMRVGGVTLTAAAMPCLSACSGGSGLPWCRTSDRRRTSPQARLFKRGPRRLCAQGMSTGAIAVLRAVGRLSAWPVPPTAVTLGPGPRAAPPPRLLQTDLSRAWEAALRPHLRHPDEAPASARHKPVGEQLMPGIKHPRSLLPRTLAQARCPRPACRTTRIHARVVVRVDCGLGAAAVSRAHRLCAGTRV